MFGILLKKELMEIFRAYFYDAKKNKKRSKTSTILFICMYVLIMVGVLGGMFGYFAYSICEPFSIVGMGWLYFLLMSMIAIALGAFGSVFNTFSCLYMSKDNDLLLSMPIPVRTIMAARMMTVYIMGLMYSAVVIIPAVVIYCVVNTPNAVVIIGGIMLTFIISMVVLILSCVLGFVVAKISTKLKNRSFITVIVSLVFITLYYVIYFRAQVIIQTLISNATVYGSKIKGEAYIVYMFGRIGEGDIKAIIGTTIVIAALFALTYYIMAKTFIGIVTSSPKTKKVVYKEKKTVKRSISQALFYKELARFTSSSAYMLNCGLGIIMLIICGGFMVVKAEQLRALLDEITTSAGSGMVIVAIVVCVIASMNDIAEPSVSLEGKSLWLSQSLPIDTWQILKAKLNVHIILTTVPSVICIICAMYVVKADIIMDILALIMVVLYIIITAMFDLIIGLKRPNLTWTNETTVIKQSFGVMIAMFGSFIYALAQGFIYIKFAMNIAAWIYMVLDILFGIILAGLLGMWLKKRGTKIYRSL
ncbi:MAG: hypothetical protein IIV51_09580 [Lachnospiraceae bacterium]|nr:hypothetical protein [Lachnospiraceae bacterium]